MRGERCAGPRRALGAIVDLSSVRLVDALAESGCPLCREGARDERREIATFVREGRFSQTSRTLFLAGGGYCRRHAWLLHSRATELGTGASIVDLYGMVLRRDLRELDALSRRLSPRRRPRPRRVLARGPCLACERTRVADERHAYFLVEALREEPVRQSYRRSDGLCVEHASSVLAAGLAEGELDVVRFIVDDLVSRLNGLAGRLAEYNRKRDYRYADEPKGDEQQSWMDVIRHYVGEDAWPREDGQ